MKTILPLILTAWMSAFTLSSAWESALTKAPAGPHKAMKKCKLHYDLTWKGRIKSGSYTIEFDRNSGKSSRPVAVTSYGHSSGVVRGIFPYDFKARTTYDGRTLRPLSYNIWEKTKKETKDLSARFSGSTVRVKQVSSPLDSTATETKTITYSRPNLFDLFTSTLYIGSQPLNNGDQINLVCFPFDKPYLIKVRVLGREKHLGHDCIKLDLKMNKVNSDGSLKQYDKMKTTTMWISDNDDRVMVELRSKIFIGDVRATLKSSEW